MLEDSKDFLGFTASKIASLSFDCEIVPQLFITTIDRREQI
jgi:hypothetical protein